jgi:hypothetical protein
MGTREEYLRALQELDEYAKAHPPAAQTEHRLVTNVRRVLHVVEPRLIIVQQHGFTLGDREIAIADVNAPCETTIRDAQSREILFRNSKIEPICRVNINTALKPALAVDDENQEAMELVLRISGYLHQNLETILLAS